MNIISARKIYEMLSLIEKQPLMYLTSKSISSLQDFLNGYFMLRHDREELYHEGEPDFENFKTTFLSRNEYRVSSNKIFAGQLLHECAGDEEKAFEKFFLYLKEFKMQ